MLWLGEAESLICNLCLSVVAHTLVRAASPLRYIRTLLGRSLIPGGKQKTFGHERKSSQLSPVFQTPHWLYRAVPLRHWQSDNRTSTAVLPHLRATQKGNLARPHSRSPQAVRKSEGPAMHCHLHRGDWSFHLTNEKKKKILNLKKGYVHPSETNATGRHSSALGLSLTVRLAELGGPKVLIHGR